jgi:hypothetical protein
VPGDIFGFMTAIFSVPPKKPISINIFEQITLCHFDKQQFEKAASLFFIFFNRD